jgi:hypothetical protein
MPAADLGRISPWNRLIAERHAASTERMLLGDCGPPQVVRPPQDEAAPSNRDRDKAEGPARTRA